MDHNEAIAAAAAERYVLGELREDERDAFEEHFFGCGECADSVRTGSTFADSTRAVGRAEDAPRKPRYSVAPWLATAASLGFAAFMALRPAAEVARVAAIEVVTPHEFVGDLRGTANAPRVLSASGTSAVFVDLTGDYASYVCEVRNAKGSVVASRAVVPTPQRDPVCLLLRALPAGSYQLVVRGVRSDGNRADVTTYPFAVR